jgi:hypothetical protein
MALRWCLATTLDLLLRWFNLSCIGVDVNFFEEQEIHPSCLWAHSVWSRFPSSRKMESLALSLGSHHHKLWWMTPDPWTSQHWALTVCHLFSHEESVLAVLGEYIHSLTSRDSQTWETHMPSLNAAEYKILVPALSACEQCFSKSQSNTGPRVQGAWAQLPQNSRSIILSPSFCSLFAFHSPGSIIGVWYSISQKRNGIYHPSAPADGGVILGLAPPGSLVSQTVS